MSVLSRIGNSGGMSGVRLDRGGDTSPDLSKMIVINRRRLPGETAAAATKRQAAEYKAQKEEAEDAPYQAMVRRLQVATQNERMESVAKQTALAKGPDVIGPGWRAGTEGGSLRNVAEEVGQQNSINVARALGSGGMLDILTKGSAQVGGWGGGGGISPAPPKARTPYDDRQDERDKEESDRKMATAKYMAAGRRGFELQEEQAPQQGEDPPGLQGNPNLDPDTLDEMRKKMRSMSGGGGEG